MRYKPHYDKNGNRIYYLAWRKIEKERTKRFFTTLSMSACAVLTGFTMAHGLSHKGKVRPRLSVKEERLAGVSSYAAALIQKGPKADQITSKNILVGASLSEQKELEHQADDREREQAAYEERQEEYAVQVQADIEAEEKRQEEERAREEAERAAEEAKRQAELAQQAALEQAMADAAEGNVPMEANRSAHPYMPYTAVTATGSKQYQILNGSDAWSDPNTGLRMVGDRICIAIGQGYGLKAGDKVDVVLDDGSIVKCILGDMKALCDTDPTARYQASDGNVVEMVVDYSVFSRNPKQYLTVFHGQPVQKLVKVE